MSRPESEALATNVALVEALVATTDRVVRETVNGGVTRVLDVREVDDGLVVHLEVLEHPEDPARRLLSRCEVELDADRRIRDVTRRSAAG